MRKNIFNKDFPHSLLAQHNYCTLSTSSLHPYFVTWFADAESCFYLRISQNSNYSSSLIFELTFSINLHQKDRALLELIQAFFGVGKINKNGKDSIRYRVSSLKELAVLMDHFDKYPLITQ